MTDTQTRTFPDGVPDKPALRLQILARRRAMSHANRHATSAAIGAVLLDAVRAERARRVCAYVPVGSEPGSVAMLDGLLHAGVEVLLPVCRPDDELDWARHTGAVDLCPGPHGTSEPSSPRLGTDAIGSADLLIVPALAVDHAGHRLGRGGGYYDRALPAAATGTPAFAVVFDDEIRPAVPTLPHDARVDGALTPRGLIVFDRA